MTRAHLFWRFSSGGVDRMTGIEHWAIAGSFSGFFRHPFMAGYSIDPEVIAKAQKTYFEKTGYNHPSQNPEVRKKVLETCMQKFGHETALQNPGIQLQIEESYLKTTGYKSFE